MGLTKAEAIELMQTEGCFLVENCLSQEFIARAREELYAAVQTEMRSFAQGEDHKDFAMVMLCSLHGGVFIDILNNPAIVDPMNWILGDGCIVYAYTSSSLPPKRGNYSTRVHVDSPRLIPNYITNLGVLVLLDDFTEDNGATWYLPRSHTMSQAPSDEYFYRNAKRLIAKAGSAFYSNARIWHAGGVNATDRWRHAMTFNMCRPYMKQRIDIPRAMAHMDLSSAPEQALQKLGFHAQVPASMQEYYLPPEQRKFRQKVE